MSSSQNSQYVEVRTESIHEKGIFAKQDISKGARIIQYIGEKISKTEAWNRLDKIENEADKQGVTGKYYVFELNKHWDIDGDVPENDAKYLNHSCDANCEIENNKKEIWIVAMRDIKKGEELTYDYGFTFDKNDYQKYPCYCNSQKCIGYIIDGDDLPKFQEHLEKLAKKTKEVKSKYLLTPN